MTMDCGEARGLLEQAFVNSDHRLLKKIRPHLAGCEACQLVYERLFAAEAALGADDGSERLLSRPEQDLLAAMVLPKRRATQRPGWLGLLLRHAPAVAAAAVIVVVVAALVDRAHLSEDPGQFAPRSGGAAGEAATSPVGLRALCLVRTKGGSLEARSLGADNASVRCGVGDRLGFSYRNETSDHWHLQVVLSAKSTRGRAQRVVPARAADVIRVAPTTDEAPLEASLQLQRAHAGPITIWALFTRERQDSDLLLGAVNDGGRLAALSRGAKTQLVRLDAQIGDRSATGDQH